MQEYFYPTVRYCGRVGKPEHLLQLHGKYRLLSRRIVERHTASAWNADGWRCTFIQKPCLFPGKPCLKSRENIQIAEIVSASYLSQPGQNPFLEYGENLFHGEVGPGLFRKGRA